LYELWWSVGKKPREGEAAAHNGGVFGGGVGVGESLGFLSDM